MLLVLKLFRNVESQPLVYTTSPSEKETEDTLWDEEKRVPDILEDLENANTTDNTGNKLGTLIGVYCPTIQNIFGVILFIRMSWIVGVCGIYQVRLSPYTLKIQILDIRKLRGNTGRSLKLRS